MLSNSEWSSILIQILFGIVALTGTVNMIRFNLENRAARKKE